MAFSPIFGPNTAPGPFVIVKFDIQDQGRHQRVVTIARPEDEIGVGARVGEVDAAAAQNGYVFTVAILDCWWVCCAYVM
jgi:hypothetical protein